MHLSPAYPTTFNTWDQEPPLSSLPLADQLSIVRLAKDTKILWILPKAIYRCAQYDAARITEITGPADAAPILTATAKLIPEHWLLIQALAAPLSGELGCTSSSACALARVRPFISRATENKADPLALVPESSWSLLSEEVCDQCLVDAKNVFRSWRLKIWEDLPGMFDLPSWIDLQKAKEADLEF